MRSFLYHPRDRQLHIVLGMSSSWVDGSWFYENEEIGKEYPQENHEEEMGRSDSPREEEVSLLCNDVTEVAGLPILYS